MEQFFDTFFDALPIISRDQFYASLEAKQIQGDLIRTLILFTAKLTNFTFTSEVSNSSLDKQLDELLSRDSLDEDVLCESPRLDNLRKACILAYYEFHQFPGPNAWMRIGKISRIAYWIGLDHLDDGRVTENLVKQGALEEWRLVWWCVYRLDSYANLAMGTPYQIDETLITTRFLVDQPQQVPCAPRAKRAKTNSGDTCELSLPANPADLYKLASIVSRQPRAMRNFNLRIIAVTAIRRAGHLFLHSRRVLRMIDTSTYDDLSRDFSLLRLALPNGYFDTVRGAPFHDETHVEYQARLVTICYLSMARLIVSNFQCAWDKSTSEWSMCWQHNIEICQDVAYIVEKLDDRLMLSIDPAITLILFASLVFLTIQLKSAGFDTSVFGPKTEHCIQVLLKRLEQFSGIWTLPKLLICRLNFFESLQL